MKKNELAIDILKADLAQISAQAEYEQDNLQDAFLVHKHGPTGENDPVDLDELLSIAEYSLQQVQAQVDKAKETLETIRKGLKADTARKFPIFSSKTNKVIGYGTDHRTRHWKECPECGALYPHDGKCNCTAPEEFEDYCPRCDGTGRCRVIGSDGESEWDCCNCNYSRKKQGLPLLEKPYAL